MLRNWLNISDSGDTLSPAAQNEVRSLLALRIALLSVALLAASIYTALMPAEAIRKVQVLYLPIAVVFGFCLISALWLRTHKPGWLFSYMQYFADALFITAVIYLTGGPLSPFLFLYLIHVMGTAIMLSRGAALLFSALNSVLYSGLILSMYLGLIAPADQSTAVPIPSQGLGLQIIGLSSALVLIAIATSFLTRKLSNSHDLMIRSQRELAELGSRQEMLFEQLPEGVITADPEDRIVAINQAALDLLGIEKQSAIGKPVAQLFEELDSLCRLDMPPGKDGSGDITVSFLNGRECLRAIYTIRPTLDAQGMLNGSVLTFRDITKQKQLEEQIELQERMARLLANHEPISEVVTSGLGHFVGESPVMQKIFSLIKRVAPSDATVLIDGESGTGKELVARAIHISAPRSKGPFIPVNCGAIPENLIESELFGHKRGAFTGAENDHIGLFRRAEGGTIFLDEIGELPLSMQSKLLRTLQERTVRPVGADRDMPIDVRIIAATNRTLRKEVEVGNFREDLFYRLNVIHIMLPPLRERKEDIPLLVNSILRRLNTNESPVTVAPAAMQLLLHYHYPGNVRELENVLERAMVLGGEVILPEHFPDALKSADKWNPEGSPQQRETQIIIDETIQFPVKLDDLLASVERRYLEIALIRTSGAKKKAAALLGINFRSFRYRLQKFGISDDSDAE